MKTTYIISLAALIFLASCGGKTDSLSTKKAELEKLKSEIQKLQGKAKTLEAEIAKMENKKDDGGKLVETEQLAFANFNSYLTITGKADADQSTIATAQVPSTITAVLVQPGQSVSAGQALAYLDNTALRQSRAQLEQQITFATTIFNKQKNLWDKGIGTEVQYLNAKNQKEALEKNLATLDAQIAMYVVKAPISGTIESVDCKIGQTAAPGLPLFKVVNLGVMKVVADVAESYSGKINQGDKVIIEFTDINKKTESVVAFASRVIDPLNRTFRIEVPIHNLPDVKPNMIAKLMIVDYAAKHTLSVPTNCIQSAENSQYVVIAVQENGKTVAKRKVVKTGHSGQDRMEILEGLNEGDQIITNGFQELIDGQVLTVSGKKEDEK